jgi:hypothetical protein
MPPETKSCQNCKQSFTIESDDFAFYEKIKVPPPTFCPECRLVRKAVWRNERALYKRVCDLCAKSIVSMYPKDAPFPVYCSSCWYSDNWDATSYGVDYDFSRNFFDQLKDLFGRVPRIALWQRNLVNSEYSNLSGESKNAYLSVSVILDSENIFYSKIVDKSSNIFDSYNIKESEGCYEVIEGEKNYNSQNLLLCRSCIDSYFLIDCINCSNCFLCYNLRNKNYCINNQQYTKEEYFKELDTFQLYSKKSRKLVLQKYEEMRALAIYRFAYIVSSVDSSGHNILNSKNTIDSFEVYNSENVKYSQRIFSSKDSMDCLFSGTSELLYEYTTGSKSDYNVKFSYSAMDAVRNADYIESCASCNNVFGGISLRNKEYVILNKVYSKEDYESLRNKIIQQMNDILFKDINNTVYRYGEFLPSGLSPFAYNETLAQEILPLTKEEAIARGYRWKDVDLKTYTITIHAKDLPDEINEVDNSILDEVIGCAHMSECNHQCTTAFKLTPDELRFYQKFGIPLPELCPNCRHYERLHNLTPYRLWHRACMCTNQGHFHREGACSVGFDTPYAPKRPEIVYCEKCYQAEVL